MYRKPLTAVVPAFLLLGVLVTPAVGEGVIWEWRNPLPQGNDLVEGRR